VVKFFIALVYKVELVPIVPNWMHATQRHKWYANRKTWSLEVEAVEQVILRVTPTTSIGRMINPES